jgi:hypothetical protein
MNITIITGICGSGKSFYCKNKTSLPYDTIYSYASKKIDYNKVDLFIEKNKKEEIYLDAFSEELITYIRDKYTATKISCYYIYTNIDDIYNCIAIEEPRQFNQDTYDNYVQSIINTMNGINLLVKKMTVEKKIDNIKYLYRTNNNYTENIDDEHLTKLLTQTKKERMLEFVDSISGCKNYQSIVMHNEFIRRGTEQDWKTMEKILECTSLSEKVIMDTGCFNGYFSFNALEYGAKKIIGIDHNHSALEICNKIAIYNNDHIWINGKKTDTSCKLGIHFYNRRIGIDCVFDDKTNNDKIDIILALNYLHHLINEHGEGIFRNVIQDFFEHTKEIIFEVNEKEIEEINKIAIYNDFKLEKKIESHRKTSFGNRWILYYKQTL